MGDGTSLIEEINTALIAADAKHARESELIDRLAVVSHSNDTASWAKLSKIIQEAKERQADLRALASTIFEVVGHAPALQYENHAAPVLPPPTDMSVGQHAPDDMPRIFQQELGDTNILRRTG